MAAARDPLVIFTPSGKRGRFPAGTPVLTAARQLGVDLDSVCGGRGICSKCQVTPAFGEFPKHGVTVAADALSPWNAVEERYDRIRGLADGRRLGCQAQIMGDVVIDVPPESQVHKQVVRKRAEARADRHGPGHPALLRRGRRARHARALRRPAAARAGARRTVGPRTTSRATCARCRCCSPRCARASGRSPAPSTTTGRRPRILHVWPGFYDGGIYGLAIDLGSTTIAGHLCDLADRRGPGLGRADEPADPLRRGPDEPGQLRDDEPRRRARR